MLFVLFWEVGELLYVVFTMINYFQISLRFWRGSGYDYCMWDVWGRKLRAEINGRATKPQKWPMKKHTNHPSRPIGLFFFTSPHIAHKSPIKPTKMNWQIINQTFIIQLTEWILVRSKPVRLQRMQTMFILFEITKGLHQNIQHRNILLGFFLGFKQHSTLPPIIMEVEHGPLKDELPLK